MADYHVLLHEETVQRAAEYLEMLQAGDCVAGGRLREMLADRDIRQLAVPDFLELLMNSKRPRIFAESEVVGDGRDWTLRELSLLGDMVIAVPVTIYDNGLHQNPLVHETPFEGTLLYVPGALLRNDNGQQAADWREVTSDGSLDIAAYTQLYVRRLLPALFYASEMARMSKRRALVTVPGLGCGLFAGKFKGQLGAALKEAIARILAQYHPQLAQIRAVYYDPYREADNARLEFGQISYLVRPLTKGNEHKPQLCPPAAYEDYQGEFADCELFSFVAWDHVSWPGNDFYVGSRLTDDGVKAAATDSMAVISGVNGSYNRQTFSYEPPEPYGCWLDVVRAGRVTLRMRDNFSVLVRQGENLSLKRVTNG